MRRKLRLYFEAKRDIMLAQTWYEEQREGLGDDFLLCVEAALAAIAANPIAYVSIQEGIHRYLLHRFPYAVFYLLTDDSIIVLAIFHHHRDPDSWRNRFGQG